MNVFLLYSSIINGLVILLLIYYKYKKSYIILYFFLILGIITSILNHGLSSKYLKYLDRYIIVISTFIFIYYILLINHKKIKILYIILILIACNFYTCSKLYYNKLYKNLSHASSHFLVTTLVYLIHIY